MRKSPCAASLKGQRPMTDKDLGESLLRLDAAQWSGEQPDLRQQTARVLERDQRRVRWLSLVTILVWLVAAVLIFADLVTYGLLMPMQAKLKEEAQAARLPPAERARLQEELPTAFQMANVMIALSVAILTVAALCTVLLVSASRRATL